MQLVLDYGDFTYPRVIILKTKADHFITEKRMVQKLQFLKVILGFYMYGLRDPQIVSSDVCVQAFTY